MTAETKSHQGQGTKHLSAPLQRDGYDINIEVDDDDIITFTGKINPRRYRTKPVNQIWSAMHTSARKLTEAWEKHYE